MRTNRSAPTSTVVPVLVYPDVVEAVAWLDEAFGFVERLAIGPGHRSQLRAGDGDLVVAEPSERRHPPRPGAASHSVMVRVEDARAHCERARRHGAEIVMEPTDFAYGERQYSAVDFAGHRWTFTETIAD